MRRRLPALPTLVAILVGGLAAALLAAPAAHADATADATVDVTNDRGGERADVRYRTALRIEGRGFQVVRGGFGGVYVLFGWVDDPRGGSWRPSRGGLTGTDYRYIPDAESTADSQGYLRFVAFPGGSTSSEAAAVLSPSGGFSVDLTVPGPVFQSVDRQGEVAEVDCREVTCGVITVGAHGVENARNETFTPVGFGTVYDAAPAAAPAAAPTAPTEAPTVPVAPLTPAASPSAPPTAPARPEVAAGAAAVSVDRATARTGRAMTFSAQGFTPGEQVVGVLDDGVAAVGPLVAGASGEVAGVLQLPADLGVGTHELRLTGAASGTVVSDLFPVATAEDAGAEPVPATAAGPGPGGVVFLLVAAAVFALALAAFTTTRLRRRRTTREVAP